METILIVDDEKNYPLILSAVLEDEGYETLTANSGREALGKLKNADVDLVLTDMKMPVMDGIALLEHIKAEDPDLPVIMMTAHGTVDKAVEAMQKGAYSYILKPFENDRLILYVSKAIAMYRVVKENRQLKHAFAAQYSFGNIIGKSQVMQEVFQLIRKVAPTSATVLIEGESGTGKELVAKAIHYNSARKERPYVPVNCSALAETLLESELFGHEKGAFTGAAAQRKGRFEMADGGTLFLDEIGELSQGLQVKLLRVLQERVFERVGGVKPISVDIRLIAATNKRLKKRGPARPVPERSVLSAECGQHRIALAAGSAGGYPAAGRAFHQQVCGRTHVHLSGDRSGTGGRKAVFRIRLAGQRAGAGERDRAGHGAVHG